MCNKIKNKIKQAKTATKETCLYYQSAHKPPVIKYNLFASVFSASCSILFYFILFYFILFYCTRSTPLSTCHTTADIVPEISENQHTFSVYF